MQRFEATAQWCISYTTHKTGIAYEDITGKLGFKTDPTIPWLPALANLYKTETNNFDGYIQKVIPGDDYMLTIQCYTLDNAALKSLKAANSEWKKEQQAAIEGALKTYAKTFTSVIDGEVRAYLYLTDMHIKEVADF